MKLRISNLGAITEGTIDLSKRINLLCGYNGTGKTYLAYVVYGMLKNRLHLRSDNELAERLINNHSATEEIDFALLLSYKNEMLASVKQNIDTIFGIGVDVAEKLFSGFSIEYADTDDEIKQYIIDASFQDETEIQGVKIAIEKKSGDSFVGLQILDANIPNDSINGIRLLLKSFIYYTLALYPISGVAVFPVERNSIYTFSKELSIRKQEALDYLQTIVNKDKQFSKYDVLFKSKRYPLPVKDGLVVAEDLGEIKKNKSKYYAFAESLESDLLSGKVQISSDGEIQFRPTKSPRTLLPVQMTASVIKTLSSLVVYLKHIANPNDLIIIDEPEINLHPDNQILLARLFARLANAGFRLMISTHSDYIIREFNNLVMVSHKDNEAVQSVAAEQDYQEDEYINSNELAVSFFEYKSKKSKHVVVSNLKVDEFGFSVDSIDNVIDSQNRATENLYYALKYGGEDA